MPSILKIGALLSKWSHFLKTLRCIYLRRIRHTWPVSSCPLGWILVDLSWRYPCQLGLVTYLSIVVRIGRRKVAS